MDAGYTPCLVRIARRLTTGWINSIQSGVDGGTGLQSESYLADLVGNIIQRQNNKLTLTESFCYDNLYRLTKSALSGDSTCTTNNNLTITYDALGNIASRSDVAGGAAWTYDATKRHAVTHVTRAGNTAREYEYDGNGNAITRLDRAIEWSKYNYPTLINGNGKILTFSYDANQQRYRQVYANGSLTETTIYVGGLLEKVTTDNQPTDWRHYVRVGSQTVAVVSRINGGANTTRYMLEDHQGSVANIIDGAGASYVTESFTAFGARRDPSSWSGPCPCPDLAKIAGVSRMGYTGHEAIGGFSMGLNHMNGRVQDAVTGKFLSPDPFTYVPENTQGFNRYSYVMNNPLTNTDPSGFCPTSYTLFCDSTGSYFEVGRDGGLYSYGTTTAFYTGAGVEYHADPGQLISSSVSSTWALPTLTSGFDFSGGGGDGGGGANPGSPVGPPTPQEPQPVGPQTCTNWAQVGAGVAATVLGGVQATAGTVEALIGAAGAPGTLGASLLVSGKGLADIAIGGIAMNDGLSLVLTGFDGVPRGTILGNAGERWAGSNGRSVGEVVNFGLGLRDLASLVRSGKGGGMAVNLLNTLVSTLPLDGMRPCN